MTSVVGSDPLATLRLVARETGRVPASVEIARYIRARAHAPAEILREMEPTILRCSRCGRVANPCLRSQRVPSLHFCGYGCLLAFERGVDGPTTWPELQVTKVEELRPTTPDLRGK